MTALKIFVIIGWKITKVLTHCCRSFSLEIVDFAWMINFMKFDYERIFIKNFGFDWSISRVPLAEKLSDVLVSGF